MPESSNATIEHRDYLQGLGFCTLPIQPGGKACTVAGWPTAGREIWQGRDGWDLAIRCGSVHTVDGKRVQLACLDADEKTITGSIERLLQVLKRVGASHTVSVVTRSGGMHAWVLLAGVPDGFNVGKWDARHGMAGELRAGRGAYALGPPSPGYTRLQGRWDALAVVDYSQLAGLLEPPKREPATVTEAVTVTEVEPAKLLALALGRAGMHKRNDTGFWLACQLRDAGHPVELTQSVLLAYRASVPQDGSQYTVRETERSVRQAYKRPPRQPGRDTRPSIWDVLRAKLAGTSYAEFDFDVLAAHLHLRAVAVHQGATSWHVSVRELAERADVGHSTANRATRRLVGTGWLKVEYHSRGVLATVYAAGPELLAVLGCAKWDTKNSHLSRWDVRGERNEETESINLPPGTAGAQPDVWRYGALGKVGRHVYELLAAGVGVVDVLAQRTGHVRSTIVRTLARLQNAGLVALSGTNWHVSATRVDWHGLAVKLGIAGHSERQREVHQGEREHFQYLAAIGKLGRRAKSSVTELLHSRAKRSTPDWNATFKGLARGMAI